jgi:WD40 repeat protein
MPHQVFLSYASDDKPVAELVCSALEAEGVRCWMAPRDIPPGQSYAAAIVRAIRDARHLVLIFSEQANNSRHVENEVERAFSQRLTIHPLRIEPVQPSPELEYFLSRPQWFDLDGGPIEERVGLFARALAAVAKSAGSPSTHTTVIAASRSKRPRNQAKEPISARESPIGEPALPSAPAPPIVVAENIRLVAALSGHETAVTSVAVSPDGSMIASGTEGALFTNPDTLRLWRARDGKLLKTFKDQSSRIGALTFSPDGSLLAAGDQFGVSLWHIPKGTEFHRMPASFVNALTFSPNGRLLAAASYPNPAEKEAGLNIWRVSDGKCLHRLPGHTNHVVSVAFSPAGDVLISGSYDNTVRIWDIAQSRLRTTLHNLKGQVSSLAFLPDGQSLLIACGDEGLKTCDLRTNKLRIAAAGCRANVMAVSPNGALVATSYEPPKLEFWSLAEGRMIQAVEAPRKILLSNRCNDLAFSPDGTTLVSAWHDKLVRIWAMA